MELLVKLFLTLLGICLFIGPLQYECRKLDGYKFPVYSTEVCPRNQTEWNERSSAINCTDNNGYLCFPNEKFTQLLEFCHKKRFIRIEEGSCLYLKKDDSAIYSYSCSSFQSGCHNTSFSSQDLFQHSSCTSIGNGCFLAEPSCKGIATTTQPPETTESIHVEIVSINANKTLKKNEFAINDEVTMIPILYGVLISISFFCIVCIIYRKGSQLWNRRDDEEPQIEIALELIQTDKPDDAVLIEQVNEEEKEKKKALAVQVNEEEEEEEEEDLISIKNNQQDKTGSIAKESPLDRAIFEQWQEDNEKFVSTRACQEVEKLIKRQNLVIVTGNSGSGKSAIIQHVALSYRKKGWMVKPIMRVKDILNVLTDKTICVFNDPIGIDSFDEIAYNFWKENENKLYSCLKKSKLLVSSKKFILRDLRVNGLLKDNLCTVDLTNEQLKLSEDEKQTILKSHSSNKNISKEEIDVIVQTEEYFPLLCKLYFSDKNKQNDILRFFCEPVNVFEENISHFKHSYKDKYCALVLLVLFNDNLCVEDIEKKDQSEEKFQFALEHCNMRRHTAPLTIKDALKDLEGFYVKNIGESYHFYNDFVMEVMIYMFGTDYPGEFIKYANIGFIRRQVKLECNNDTKGRFTIILSDKYVDILAERLVNELYGESLLEVVLNPCLKTKNFIHKFITEMEKQSHKFKMLIEKKRLRKAKSEYPETKRLFLSKLAFLNLETQITPLFALSVFCHKKVLLYFIRALDKQQRNMKDNSLFSAICCNGSIDLFDMFSTNQMMEFLEEKWGHLYPVHIVSVFHNFEMLRELIELKADVNLRDRSKSGFTPLMYAAGNNTNEYDEITNQRLSETRRDKTVEILLNNGAEKNLCSTCGASPLFLACVDGYLSTVQVLLKHGVDINLCNKNRASPSPLFIACQNGHERTVQLLLKNGAEIDLRNTDGASPLFIACKNGHERTVQLLLKNGADIDLRNKDGASPLYIACQKRHDSAIKLLLKRGANINSYNTDGVTHLYIACRNEHDRAVKYLLKYGADINLGSEDRTSPLYKACEEGFASIVQLLITNGALVNICNKMGKSPLYAACENRHDSIVPFLLNMGAAINSCDYNRTSPLFIACENGHESTVQLLLDNKADVNLCKRNGTNPLYIACRNGHGNIVNTLLRRGAIINLCNLNETNALRIAYKNGHHAIVESLLNFRASLRANNFMPLHLACIHGYVHIVKFLLNKYADVNILTEGGASPLYLACEYGNDSIVQLLLSNRADINLCNTNGSSPLYVASENGHERSVQLLLSNGADINLCNTYGSSPLYVASENGHERSVQLLLSNGADINLCNTNGSSPLYIASENGHDSIVKLLLYNGADIHSCNINKESALYIACQSGHDSTVELLLSNKSEINVCEKNGISPISIACYKGHDSTVNILLKYGADIDVLKTNGSSPLHMACFNGHDSTVKLLLENNININISSKYESSPLFIACYRGHKSIVKLLLSNGADINLCTYNFKRQLPSNIHRRHEKSIDSMPNIKTCIDQIFDRGVSPLYIAFACRHYEIVQLLIDCDAEKSIIDGFGINSVPKEWYDITGQFLLQENNIIKNLHDLDSYFSLFVFCQVEQFSRSSRLINTMFSSFYPR